MTNTKLLTLEPTVQMMIRQSVDAAKPSGIVAYLLCILGGLIGLHHFYLASKCKGRLRTVFAIIGVVYLFTLGCGLIGAFIDLFLIPLYLSVINQENEETIVNEYLVANGMMEATNVQPKVESYSVDEKYDDSLWRGKQVYLNLDVLRNLTYTNKVGIIFIRQ